MAYVPVMDYLMAGALGMSSILAAMTFALARGESISEGIDRRFVEIGSSLNLGIAYRAFGKVSCILVAQVTIR